MPTFLEKNPEMKEELLEIIQKHHPSANKISITEENSVLLIDLGPDVTELKSSVTESIANGLLSSDVYVQPYIANHRYNIFGFLIKVYYVDRLWEKNGKFQVARKLEKMKKLLDGPKENYSELFKEIESLDVLAYAPEERSVALRIMRDLWDVNRCKESAHAILKAMEKDPKIIRMDPILIRGYNMIRDNVRLYLTLSEK